MAITPVTEVRNVIVDATVDTDGGTPGVPTSRQITAPSTFITVNGGASHDLSADIVLAGVSSPAGATTVVGTARTIQGTAPILVNGDNAAHDHTANFTISAVPFNGTNSGYVVKNSSIQGKFYRDDGSWQSGTAAGVSSIIAGNGISVNVATGDVTVSGQLAGIANQGDAPATGGVFPTKVLTATSPPSWQSISALAGFVSLQASYPGLVDTGNAHVTGILGADTALVAGGTTRVLTAAVTAENDGLSAGFAHAVAAVSGGPGFHGYRSRGTLGSPSATLDNDRLVEFIGYGWANGNFINDIGSGLTVRADGNASTRQPTYVDIIGGDVSAYSQIRLGQVGTILGKGGLANSDRAKSTVDILGSLGIKTVAKTANFTADALSTFYLLDCTSNAVDCTLPAATGCVNRVYGFQKIDDTWRRSAVISSASDVLAGLDGLFLARKGEVLWVGSDGTNWFVLNHNGQGMQSATRAYQAAVGMSTNLPVTAVSVSLYDAQAIGATFGIKIRGTYSTSGTPTVQFQFQETDFGNDMATFPAAALANGASDYAWEIDGEWTIVTSGGGTGTAIINKMTLGVAAASGIMTYYTCTGLITNSFDTLGVFGLRLMATFSASNAANNVRVRGLSTYVHQFTNPTV